MLFSEIENTLSAWEDREFDFGCGYVEINLRRNVLQEIGYIGSELRRNHLCLGSNSSCGYE